MKRDTRPRAFDVHRTLWKDATNYSRFDEVREPTCWEAKYGMLRIVITCGHIDHPHEWVMHCPALFIDSLPLEKGLDKEGAKRAAVYVVRTKLETLSRCLAHIELVTPRT